ncbi:MAG: ABC transporter substrate-binding protein [Anaerolineae bacterium]|nr:ABC transporter substrate-binding protein [Anaerolineae bacterium]
MKRVLVVWALAVLLATGCAKATPEAKSLVFMAGYQPQADLPFVGVYVAQEKGFFAEEALTVDIRHTAGKGEHLQLLVAGMVDVTTQDAAVLLKRRADPGLPLVSIALVGQRGQQAFVALADSGIQTPQDWTGHTIGYKGTPPPDLLAMLDVAGLIEADVELINVGFDPRVLTEGMVDVYPVYNSNEPYLLQSWGYELVQWEAADYGIPTLGLTYVTTPDIIAKDPERIERFLRAALHGIAYAEDHVDEAVEIVLKYTGPETDPNHMRFMLETEIADAHSTLTEEHGIGWQTEEQWQALIDSLLQYGALAGPVEADEAFTNQFLEALQKK